MNIKLNVIIIYQPNQVMRGIDKCPNSPKWTYTDKLMF